MTAVICLLVDTFWKQTPDSVIYCFIEVARCTVPFSLFADPERILRRLNVFAEEPYKSTNKTSEPCSPVFKEAQPRPSEHSNLEYHINNLNLYLYAFGL